MRSPGWRAASAGLGVASAALGMYGAYEFGYNRSRLHFGSGASRS